MALICYRCGTAHEGTCEEARREREKLQREVEHHRQHCEFCPNPYQHVLNLRRKREPKPPIFR